MAFIDHDLTDLTERMKALDKSSVKTGIQAGSPHLQKAIWTNYGTKHIPERPAISEFNNRNEDELKELCKKQVKSVVKRKKPAKNALKAVADKTEKMMFQDVVEWDTPGNAEATIQNKGFDDPWIETGETAFDIQAKIKGG